MSSNQADFEVKKQALIDQFLSKDGVESDEERDKALENLCVEIFKLKYEYSDITDEELAVLIKSFKEKMAEMECNDPRLAHPINGLKKIGNSNYGEASRYVVDLLKLRQEEFSADQKKRAQSPRPDELTELIKSYLRFTPDMTANQVLHRLQSDIGKGVIAEITDEEIFYHPTKGNEVKTSVAKINGLSKRLSRLKTTYN